MTHPTTSNAQGMLSLTLLHSFFSIIICWLGFSFKRAIYSAAGQTVLLI